MKKVNNDLVTSDEILGKEVVNNEGEIIGIVQKIHLNRYSKEIIGITVDEGFMKPDLFIGVENVKLFGIDAVFLNTSSDLKYRGLDVFSSEGEIRGTVYEVVKYPKSGKIKEIVVKKGLKTVIVPAKDIKSIGLNVILK